MDNLTAEQRAMVAREAIGDVVDEHPWDPENEAWQWQILVECLASLIDRGDRLLRAYNWGLVRRYINTKDTPALELLCYRMMEKDNG